MFLLSFAFGGIGGAIIAPFLGSRVPSAGYIVSGTTLLGTFLTSVVGVIFTSLLPGDEGPACIAWRSLDHAYQIRPGYTAPWAGQVLEEDRC